MNIDETFPYKVVLTRKSRQDRRDELTPKINEIGMNVEWFYAVESYLFKNDSRKFSSLATRSIALNKRMILRNAGLRKDPSILMFEDDIIFHPNFNKRIKKLELPSDWGIFYLGCYHIETPTPISDEIVRVQKAYDLHAVGIKKEYFLTVRKIMRGKGKEKLKGIGTTRGNLDCDVMLSTLHKEIPTYAAYPNLVWQSKSYSDNTYSSNMSYLDDGSQKYAPFYMETLSKMLI